MVYGLNPEKMNCDRLFNLFCLYGNVIKVITGISKQAGGRRSSGGCYEVYRRLICFGTLIIFKQIKNVNSTKLLCFSLFSTLINVILSQPCFCGLV